MTLNASEPYRSKLATLRHELLASIGLSMGAVTVRLLTRGAMVWELTVDVSGNAIRCGDISFPLPSLPWPRPTLRLLLDGSVIESFIGAREALTSRVYSLQPDETELEVTVTGNKSVALSQWSLDSISPDRLTT
jgi:beta-fructofuranosidase